MFYRVGLVYSDYSWQMARLVRIYILGGTKSKPRNGELVMASNCMKCAKKQVLTIKSHRHNSVLP